MKFLLAILSFFVLAVSTAPLNYLAHCSGQCLTTSMQAIGCRSSDFRCACSFPGRNQILPYLTACIETTCNLPDEGRAIGFFDKMCSFADAFSHVRIVQQNLEIKR